MSGICGIYYLDAKPIDNRHLGNMLDQLAHRGPEGAGLWQDGSVGLGHQMLHTTPESLSEKLPWMHPSEQWVITADARLDNRAELMTQLGLGASSAAGLSDSQLILAAYRQWGDRTPEYLLGDFAFAIWDQSQQRLFLARDHFGVKPLYYYCDRRVFAFATEIKALLALPEIPKRLNKAKVADYLASLFDNKAITFYEEILRLPPAQFLAVTPADVKRHPYWALDPHRELHLASDEDYAEALRSHFETAVSCRLRSVFPVGAFLSGGLDSSAIACVARNRLLHQNQPALKTFSAIFDSLPQCDELEYIDSVVAQGHIDAHYIPADQLTPLADLEKTLWHQDEAFAAPNLFMHQGIYRAAQGQQVRTLLDGFDGDTTISHGLPYLSEMAREGRWVALLQGLRGVSKTFNTPLNMLLWRYLWKQGLRPRAPKRVQRLGNRLHRKLSDPAPVTLRLQEEFVDSVSLRDRVRQLNAERQKTRTAREAHSYELSSGVLPFAMEITDRAAAAHHIAPSFPFFDKRLVEFCVAIPPEQKIHKGWTRLVMRRAMNNILPTKVQWRPGKSDLSPNFHGGLRDRERDCLARIMQEDTALIEPYVDIATLQATYQRFLCEGSLPDSAVLSIWKPITLALWLKQTGLT